MKGIEIGGRRYFVIWETTAAEYEAMSTPGSKLESRWMMTNGFVSALGLAESKRSKVHRAYRDAKGVASFAEIVDDRRPVR